MGWKFLNLVRTLHFVYDDCLLRGSSWKWPYSGGALGRWAREPLPLSQSKEAFISTITTWILSMRTLEYSNLSPRGRAESSMDETKQKNHTALPPILFCKVFSTTITLKTSLKILLRDLHEKSVRCQRSGRRSMMPPRPHSHWRCHCHTPPPPQKNRPAALKKKITLTVSTSIFYFMIGRQHKKKSIAAPEWHLVQVTRTFCIQ